LLEVASPHTWSFVSRDQVTIVARLCFQIELHQLNKKMILCLYKVYLCRVSKSDARGTRQLHHRHYLHSTGRRPAGFGRSLGGGSRGAHPLHHHLGLLSADSRPTTSFGRVEACEELAGFNIILA
jgi:hypothetical protein